MSGNFYVSPETSSSGSKNSPPVNLPPVNLPPVNLKPTLNESLMNTRSNRKVAAPKGVFTKNNRGYVFKSREWGKPPFFKNAKSSSMLERGWIKLKGPIQPGTVGLYTSKDGPENEVTVVNGTMMEIGDYLGTMYTFETKSGVIFKSGDDDRHEEWDFYYPTTAKKFVPRGKGGKGGKRNKTRKMRRKA